MITDDADEPRGPGADSEEFLTPALIGGEVIEVPVSSLRFDYACYTDRRYAFAAQFLYRGLCNGDRRFIPILWERGDGALMVTGFISRQ
jgi:hypothetical protein